jgi:hypothetical protein
MFLKTILSSIFLINLAAQSTAFPLNQNEKRASYSIVNVDGSNGGSNPIGGFQTLTETVTHTHLQTVTMEAVTVTVVQSPTPTPYDDGLWHPPYYKVADSSSAAAQAAPSTAASSTTFSTSAIPIPTITPTYRNSTR